MGSIVWYRENINGAEANMQAFHHSWDTWYRSPFGAVSVGMQVQLRLRVWDAPQAQVFLRVFEGGQERILEPVEESEGVFSFLLDGLEKPGLVYYHFAIRWAYGLVYYGVQEDGIGGEGVLTEDPHGFQITVTRPTHVPQWLSQGVMYQIYVDRFCNSNGPGRVRYARPGSLIHAAWEDTPFYIRSADQSISRWDFFGGDLPGVTSKLDLLRQRGVTVLYLNPIFEAVSNHKYDTGDYRRVDPGYGTEADLRELVQKAHSLGMRVILDGVFSHTGSDSLYFNALGHYPSVGAAQSPASPYAGWYRFEVYPTRYDCWWGVLNMPCVEELHPGYLDFMLRDEDSTVRRWMRCGIDGWRLDVADELPDAFLMLLHQVVREENPDAILIGEVWEDASHKVSYDQLRTYFTEGELDSVTNYPFRDAMTGFLLGHTDAYAVHRTMMGLYENYPKAQFYSLMNMTGTHDTLRLMTLLGEAPALNSLTEEEREHYSLPPWKEAMGRIRVQLYSLLQFTHPGLPTVYYGDETALQGYTDPYNRGPYPWGREDGTMVAWFAQLAGLRESHPALTGGDYAPFALEADVYGHWRRGNGEIWLAAVYRNTQPCRIELPPEAEDMELVLCTGEVQKKGRWIAAGGVCGFVLCKSSA